MPDLPVDWNITALEPLAAGIGGTVWQARRTDGAPVIVKAVSALAAAEANQATAYLRWRDGEGAVRLLGEHGGLQLLEHAGSRSLLDMLREKGDMPAAAIAADAIHKLHQASPLPTPSELMLVSRRFASLFAKAETDRKSGLASLFVMAAPIAAELVVGARGERPLHGDFHHENLLFGRRGWLAIDPHGLFGDPAYDCANMFYNPVQDDALRTNTKRHVALAALLAPAVGRDEPTLLRYAFCHACLSASWHDEDGDTVERDRSLAVASSIRPLITA